MNTKKHKYIEEERFQQNNILLGGQNFNNLFQNKLDTRTILDIYGDCSKKSYKKVFKCVTEKHKIKEK